MPALVPSVGSRFYVTRRLVVGNASEYLSKDRREYPDSPYCYRWLLYVRGPPGDDASVESFVRRVRFTLHESYRPYDVIEVSEPPFQITQYGWAESTVLLQLEFADPQRNPPVEIAFRLKLDAFKTGRQKMGDERIVDVELDRQTVFLERAALAANGAEPLARPRVSGPALSESSAAVGWQCPALRALAAWGAGRTAAALVLEAAEADAPFALDRGTPLTAMPPAQAPLVGTGEAPRAPVDHWIALEESQRAARVCERAHALVTYFAAEKAYAMDSAARHDALDQVKLLPESVAQVFAMDHDAIVDLLEAQARIVLAFYQRDATLQLQARQASANEKAVAPAKNLRPL